MIQSAPFDPLVAGHLIVEMGNLAIQKKKKRKELPGEDYHRPFYY